jgi:acyl carrier protein
MSSVTIRQQVRNFLKENFFLGEDFIWQDRDSFLENGIIDSTGVLQLIAFLEETYGIAFEEGELTPENLDSIDNIAAYLQRKRAGVGQDAAATGEIPPKESV